MSLAQDLRVIRAVAAKDIRVSLVERLFTMLSLIVPINFLFLFILLVLSGGQAPTAVVLDDPGPLARQFLAAMEGAHSFQVQETTAAQARDLLARGEIVAVVTVPAGFDADLRAGRPVSLPVEINNLDVDFTNDIRRAVPLAITSFYANAFPDQVVVHADERDLQPSDTGYISYLSVSIVVIGIMIAGLLQAGSAAAREYETGTIKELLLSPASRWAIEAGKALGALVVALFSAAIVLAAIVLVLGVWPVHWGEVVVFSLLLVTTFVALGLLVGTVVRRRQAVIPLSFGLSLPLFFMSGAFGPANWGAPAAFDLARISPVYFAIGVFQHAFHGYQTTPSGPTTNLLVLVGFSVVAIALSAVVLRRTQVSH